MPYSAFFQGSIIIRSTTTMSLKPGTHHIALARPSLLGCFMKNGQYHTHSVAGLFKWNAASYLPRHVTCLASSRTADPDWKQRHQRRSPAAVPSWYHRHQSFSYGRFAYQDASASEDSDREFGSSHREMVSLYLLILVKHLNSVLISIFQFQF